MAAYRPGLSAHGREMVKAHIQHATNFAAACIVGDDHAHGALRREALSDRRERLPSVLRSYDEIVVEPNYFDDLDQSLDFYRIEYEGALPNSNSKHGFHGGFPGHFPHVGGQSLHVRLLNALVSHKQEFDPYE